MPGDRKEQLKLLEEDVEARVCVYSMVFLKPHVEEGAKERYFTRVVTCVNHALQPAAEKVTAKHGGVEIKLATKYDAQITLEVHHDDLQVECGWTHAEIKKIFETSLLAWAPKGSFEAQWVTMRHLRDLRKAVLIVRADTTARKELLTSSGTTVVFTRERLPKDVAPEYTVVWLQNPQKH